MSVKKKLNEIQEQIDKLQEDKNPEELPGVMEAPQNIPENASGNLKIILE